MKKINIKRTRYLIAAAAVVIAPFGMVSLRAENGTNTDVQSLIQRVKELEEKVKILERNREVDQEAAAEKAKSPPPAPTVSLGAKGLIVRSADSNFVMNVHGYAQLDGRFYLNDPNTANDTFLLRRVRPIIEGTVYDKYDYRLMLDLASGNVSGSTTGNNLLIDDAYLNARFWPEVQIQAGKYKSPVGLERLKSVQDQIFVETGFATTLTPNYDTGIEIHNNLFNEPISYAVGVFDGSIDNGSSDNDTTDEGKDVAGRLFFQPFLTTDVAALRGLGFGAGGSVGKHIGPEAAYKTPGQQTFFNYSATAANTVTANGRQYRIDPQAFYYWGPFGIVGEYILSSQEVQSTSPALPRTRFNNTAWEVGASYFLTGEDNSFRSPEVLHPFRLGEGGGWGAFEIGARVGQLSLDNDIFTPHAGGATYAAANSAQKATSWGVEFNWYLNNNVKLNLDYESTSYKGGSLAVGSVTSKQEHAILSRIQFSF